MNVSPPSGLRDRKRVETRARLEAAAVTIALRDGPDHVTVDAISEAADVSARTFFNYFESKDDAILGLRDLELTDAEIEAHIAAHEGETLIRSVVALLFGILGPSITESELRRNRKELLHRHPHLLGRQIVQMTRMTEQLTAAVDTLVARDPQFSTDGRHSPPGESQTSGIIIALCAAGVRAAVIEWAAAGSDASIDELQHRAISLVKTVTEKLQ